MSIVALGASSAVLFVCLWKSCCHACHQYRASTEYINNISAERRSAPGGSRFYRSLTVGVRDFGSGVTQAYSVRDFTSFVWLPASVVAMLLCGGAVSAAVVSGSTNSGLVVACFAISGVALSSHWLYPRTKSFTLYRIWGMEITAVALKTRHDELVTLVNEFREAHVTAEANGTEIDPAWIHAERVLAAELASITEQMNHTDALIKYYSEQG